MQFLCAPIIGNLSDRFGRRPVLILSLLMLGVDYAITGLAPTIAWLFIGRTLSGMAGACLSHRQRLYRRHLAAGKTRRQFRPGRARRSGWASSWARRWAALSASISACARLSSSPRGWRWPMPCSGWWC